MHLGTVTVFQLLLLLFLNCIILSFCRELVDSYISVVVTSCRWLSKEFKWVESKLAESESRFDSVWLRFVFVVGFSVIFRWLFSCCYWITIKCDTVWMYSDIVYTIFGPDLCPSWPTLPVPRHRFSYALWNKQNLPFEKGCRCIFGCSGWELF